MRIALLGQDGEPFLWLPSATLIPPPAVSDNERYRRTIVNSLQRQGLRTLTSGVAVALYSSDSGADVRAELRSSAETVDLVRIPLSGSGDG